MRILIWVTTKWVGETYFLMVYKRKFVFLLFFSFKNQSSQINLYVICQTQKIVQSKLKKKKKNKVILLNIWFIILP